MARPAAGYLGMTAGALRAFVILSVITVALTFTTWYHGNTQAGRLTREVQSQCRFDGDLAGLPVALNPATHQASKLGVQIVSDSRVAWLLAGCPGKLAPPSPSFTRWAKFYRLPTG